MENTQPIDKLIWVDKLRVIATVSVIFLHVSSEILPQYVTIPNSVWWIGNIYDSCVRFCVPIFLMITGALLLPKNYDLGLFLKKRLLRIIYPFAFWSFIYILFNLILKIYHGDKITFLSTCKWIILQIVNGASYHLWYIYMILGIYLFIPIIGKWVRGCNDREIVYFLLIWACTLLLNQPILSKLKIGIGLTYFSGYLGYVVLGYYLATKTFKNIKLLNIISTYLILSGLVVTIIGTYLLSSSSGKFNGIFYSYLSPNVLIVSIGIFLVSKNNQAPNQKIFGIVSFISKFSFGIYLIHILVLSVLYKIGINWDFINPIIGIPITSFICLFISGGIVYCVNKLPYGNYVSG